MSKIKNKYNILWFGEDMWKKLNHILIEKGMTKKELAEKAGISKNTIQNIRNSKISFRNMVKIADALDVSLDEFRKDNT